MMTSREWALRFDAKIIGQYLNAAQLELLANMFDLAISAAIEEDRKARPHQFVGRSDRWCELCNKPDRDVIHIMDREHLQRWIDKAVEEKREACAKIVKQEIERWDRESVVELRESILHEIEIGAWSEGQEKKPISFSKQIREEADKIWDIGKKIEEAGKHGDFALWHQVKQAASDLHGLARKVEARSES